MTAPATCSGAVLAVAGKFHRICDCEGHWWKRVPVRAVYNPMDGSTVTVEPPLLQLVTA